MKKNISKLLNHAEVAAKTLLKKDKEGNDYIPKEYKAYISSFGAAITQSGLMPALYFNHQSGGSAEDRKKLMDAVFIIIKSSQTGDYNNINLLEYAKEQTNNVKEFKNSILDAATALKLVIRTYKLK